MQKFLILVLFFCGLLQAEPNYITFPSDIDWQTKESDHFQIIFRKDSDAFAIRALRAAERAYKILVPIFVEAPEKTWIVLADFQDSTNGYALNFPYSHIVVFASPPESSGQLSNLDDWLDSILLHEYVHILHLYPAHGLWSPMRTIFGTWVVPNGMMPSHFHEGMATFLETEKTRGGRGRGSHFSMYRRKAVEAGAWGQSFFPLDLMDGTTSKWPHGVSAYLFGETLTRELWIRKGAKGVYNLTQSYSDNWPYFLTGPLEEVFGTNYSALWQDIYKRTSQEALKEIKKIKESPVSTLNYLTKTKYRKLDPTLSPDGTKVAYRLDSPYRDDGGIQVIETATGKLLSDFEFSMGSAESMCWGKVGPEEYLVFVNNTNSRQYSTNYIFTLDTKTGVQNLMLSPNAKDTLKHVHRLACSADLKTLYVYKEVGGNGSLAEAEATIAPDKAETKVIRSWKLPVGSWISSILVDESPIFTLKTATQTQFYRWRKGAEPERLLAVNAFAYSLRRGTTKDEVWAILSVDGRDEVWAVNLATKKASKRVAVVGGINGFDRVSDKTVVSSYEHGGYDIASATLVAGPQTNISQDPESPADPGTEIKVSPSDSYSPLHTIFPRTWLPNMLFVPDGLQVGALVTWFDLSQRHLYSIFGGFDSRAGGALFGDAGYQYRFGGSFTNDWSAFYSPSYLRASTTGTVAQFQKRWGAGVGLSGTIGSFPPTIRLAALFRRLESSALSPTTQSIGGEIDLTYRTGFSRRPLSISPVNGAVFKGSHQQFFKGLGSSHNYFISSLSAEGYVEAPWWRDSVWYVGSRVGYTEGSPFYNSYFEGGGEVLFTQGRGVFLNRGFLSATFLARRMFNANLEYRFPLAWIERGINLWPGKLNVIHAALVGDVTSWDYGPSAVSTTGTRLPKNLFKTFYYSAGVELKSDWKFFYYLPTQLRIGAYHGFGPYGENIQIACGVEASL